MPTARSLADGHIKFIICTTKPDNPALPTVAELAAGIDASCNILASDFTWGATDSDKVAEKALCTINNANALGASNYNGGLTPFRYFDTSTKLVDATADAVFAALKVKGTTAWGYARKSAKLSTAAVTVGDELYLGAEFATDSPQAPSDQGGWIKFRVPLEIQNAYEFITVAA
jgi:hypothetical protein